MSVEQNTAAARRLFEDPGPGQEPGRQGVIEFFRQLRVAFPDPSGETATTGVAR